MDRTIALPDDRPRISWAKVARDIPRALGVIATALATLLFAGLLTP